MAQINDELQDLKQSGLKSLFHAQDMKADYLEAENDFLRKQSQVRAKKLELYQVVMARYQQALKDTFFIDYSKLLDLVLSDIDSALDNFDKYVEDCSYTFPSSVTDDDDVDSDEFILPDSDESTTQSDDTNDTLPAFLNLEDNADNDNFASELREGTSAIDDYDAEEQSQLDTDEYQERFGQADEQDREDYIQDMAKDGEQPDSLTHVPEDEDADTFEDFNDDDETDYQSDAPAEIADDADFDSVLDKYESDEDDDSLDDAGVVDSQTSKLDSIADSKANDESVASNDSVADNNVPRFDVPRS